MKFGNALYGSLAVPTMTVPRTVDLLQTPRVLRAIIRSLLLEQVHDFTKYTVKVLFICCTERTEKTV